MIEQSLPGLQICGGGRSHVIGSIGRSCKSVPVAGEAGAIARTFDTNNPDHSIGAFRGYSHAAVAKGEIERVDRGLIAEGGKRHWMTEDIQCPARRSRFGEGASSSPFIVYDG